MDVVQLVCGIPNNFFLSYYASGFLMDKYQQYFFQYIFEQICQIKTNT